MGLFGRRKEPLHEKLMREAALEAEPPSADPLAPVPTHPLPGWRGFVEGAAQRPRRWDAVVTAEEPSLEGDEVEFLALPDGTLLVEDETGETRLGALADAVEAELAPPYRARGVRHSDTLWAVSAVSIEIAELTVDAEELVLSAHEGERSLTVDGEPSRERLPELEALGRGDSYVLTATRLDGDLWEVDVKPL